MQILFTYAAAIEAGPLPGIAATTAEFLELGIGKAHSAHTLTMRLGVDPRPDLVVLFGVCGAYQTERNLGVGDLCLVENDCLADEGVQTEREFLDLHDLGLPAPTAFAMDIARTKQARQWLRAPQVRGATVSTCAGNDRDAIARATRSGADIETMEGAAVALVCEQLALPLVQLRCVSNRTGDRDAAGWKLQRACDRVQAAVRELLTSTWLP